MKKLIFILSILLLVGCTTPTVEQEMPEVESHLEQKEYLFEKNQECAKWVPKIKQRMEEFRKTNTEWIPSLQEVFYSPKTNSCLYIDHVQQGEDYPYIMKRLVDVSHGIAVDPIDDMSCEFIWDYEGHNKLRDYFKTEGEEALRRFDQIHKGCDEFDKKIEEEYK